MDERQKLPKPGWYTDPEGEVRWWDGAAWTEQVRPRIPSSAVDVVPAEPPPAPAVTRAPVPVAEPAAPAAPPAAAAGVLTLERPVVAPAPAAVLPPRTTGRGRGRRRLSPVVTGAALLAVLGVLASYFFSTGILGAPATAEEAAIAPAGLAADVPSEPGTGTFADAPAPPADFVGKGLRFTSTGRGSWVTPGFLLAPADTWIETAAEGAQGDVVLTLLPQFEPTDPLGATSQAACPAPCTSAAWAGQWPPGRYRLAVTTTAATTWSLEIWQQIPRADAPVVVNRTDLTSLVRMRSRDNDTSTPFTVTWKPSAEGLVVIGSVTARGAFKAYLVPRGRELDPKRDLLFAQRSGKGGEFQAKVRTRGQALTQGYTLVVRTDGPWTVRFETS